MPVMRDIHLNHSSPARHGPGFAVSRVYCQQLIDGEAIDPEWVIEPHSPTQTSEELLHLKAESAAEKGWDVEWLSGTEFVARMVRWNEAALCERIFRVGP